MKSALLITVATCAFISSSASAAMATFQQYDAWAFSVTHGILLEAPLWITTETFNAYSGTYANPLVGNAGPIEWSATAYSYVPNPTNIVANSGWLSTYGADENLVFNFAPGVHAVGGNFFSRDAAFQVTPALVGIFFEDGSSSIQFVSSVDGFSGFISSSLAISSLTCVRLQRDTCRELCRGRQLVLRCSSTRCTWFAWFSRTRRSSPTLIDLGPPNSPSVAPLFVEEKYSRLRPGNCVSGRSWIAAR